MADPPECHTSSIAACGRYSRTATEPGQPRESRLVTVPTLRVYDHGPFTKRCAVRTAGVTKHVAGSAVLVLAAKAAFRRSVGIGVTLLRNSQGHAGYAYSLIADDALRRGTGGGEKQAQR